MEGLREQPQDWLETTLARVWTEVFQREPVSGDDNFFELGGNSLQAMELMDRISAQLGVALPAVMLFQNPTPRQLARCIDALGDSADPDAPLDDEYQAPRGDPV